MDRDTQKCAFKCCYAEVQGKGVNVYKDPITDKGKVSKKGRLTLECDEKGEFKTVQGGKGDPVKVRRIGTRLPEVFEWASCRMCW